MDACIAVLVHFGANLEARNSQRETALVQAVPGGDYRTADFLVRISADAWSRDDDGNVSLLCIESEAQKWRVEHGLTATWGGMRRGYRRYLATQFEDAVPQRNGQRRLPCWPSGVKSAPSARSPNASFSLPCRR